MPTPKQVRKHYGAVRYHWWKLQQALNRAHEAKLIDYEDYVTEAPCAAMDTVRLRIDATTEKARAKAMKEEILNDVKGIPNWMK